MTRIKLRRLEATSCESLRRERRVERWRRAAEEGSCWVGVEAGGTVGGTRVAGKTCEWAGQGREGRSQRRTRLKKRAILTGVCL